MRLNLGCGRYPKTGFVNLDRGPLPGVDVVHDLASFPYPFEDGQFELIEADHVLEHLSDAFGAMREIHRILKPGSTLIVRVPHFSRGFSHPEHKCGFDVTFPFYFDPKFPGGYAGVQFISKHTRLKWFAQPALKKAVLGKATFAVCKTLGVVLDFLANLSPACCSRTWCYLVGGFEEIEFTFVRP